MGSATQMDSDESTSRPQDDGSQVQATAGSREKQETSPRVSGEMSSRTTQHSRVQAPPEVSHGIPSSSPISQAEIRSPSLTSPESGLLSPGSADRVFPMRSFVSVDPTPKPQLQGVDKVDNYFGAAARLSGKRRLSVGQNKSDSSQTTPLAAQPQTTGQLLQTGLGVESATERDDGQTKRSTRSGSLNATPDQRSNATHAMQLFEDAGSTTAKSESVGSVRDALTKTPSSTVSNIRRKDQEEPRESFVTARFQHIVTEGGHAIITGRDGDILQRCEDEPIHIPGAVQGFGLLIALKDELEGKLVVRIVSENSKRVIGYTPSQLFSLDSFTDILSDDQTDNLLDHIEFIKDDGTDVEANGPEVFTMSVRTPQKRSRKLWCAVHQNTANPDLIICEFELEDDPQYPLVPPHTETPEPPEDTLNASPTNDEYRESTEATSRPLRVLRSARKRKGEAAAMEVFNIMSQVQEQLAEAPNIEMFLKVLVGVIKELTGFHRVMIYQFDEAWNGRVVTELVDPRATKDLYKGLHFPASDIPKQARDLYRINKVRLLYDRDQETARLVCRTSEDLETPLDLAHSYLRAMSPIHVKYLANMAVRSSMSISINAFNELWGLISCHAYGSKGTRVSFPIRKMCRLVGDSASRNIERLSYASRLQARKLINTVPTEKNPSGYIIASSEDLLTLFDADFGMLSIHGETKILGKLEAIQEALAMLEYLRLRKITSVMTSQDVRFDFPDLRYPPGFVVIAGLLHVPLSSSGEDFIAFFRKGQRKEVKWAGNPYEKFVKDGTEGYLEPRKSFKTWSETVVGKCREWSEEEIETAAVLCLVYGKFIEVWRQKEAVLQNSQLTKLLLANSAHEVRTPLNAIINCLEIALEGTLDQETRENLARSHSASKSLIYVINDLLDLTKSVDGPNLTQGEVFNLRTTFQEATDAFKGDATRKQIQLEVIEHPGIPEKVIGEQRRVRQAISNVTANAIQATSQGGVSVELCVVSRSESHVDVEIAVEDTGIGMNSKRQDTLFTELEQVQLSDPGILIDDGDSTDQNTFTEIKDSRRVLGLGLAIVARIVRNMDGQVRLKSEEGKGSRFVLQLPFDLPASELQQPVDGVPLKSPLPTSSLHTSADAREMTLVGKLGASNRRDPIESPSLTRKNSVGSIGSKKSMKSYISGRSIASSASAKTDVDRLIDAMQEMPSVERPSLGERQLSRSSNPLHSDPFRSRPTSPEDHPHTSDTQRYLGRSETQSPSDNTGERSVAHQRTPIKAIKVPGDGGLNAVDVPRNANISFVETQKGKKMNVLVAEDDPINSKIIKKRLDKAEYATYLTVNGEECASMYGEKPGFFDVILMDMQMPIVDGGTAAKMIRSFEKTHPSHFLSENASVNGRVPIIAVSASLVEKERQNYVDAGFDGWILKPISFSRLRKLMDGITDREIRKNALYRQGHWENGGWFHEGLQDVFATVNMTPGGGTPSTDPVAETQPAAA